MRSLTGVALLAGPLVLAGYLVGTLVALLSGRGRRAPEWLLEAFAAVGVSTVAWYTIKAVSPGSSFSRVALASNQVLIVWQSVALWAGLGVVVGQVAPLLRRFRGVDGLPAAVALLAVYVPVLAVGAAVVVGVGTLVLRTQGRAAALGMASLVPLSWLAWILEAPPAWGVAPGPEVSLWATGLAVGLFARWWADNESR